MPSSRKAASESRGDKSEQLLAAACELFHQRGVAATTLADIAGRSGVPLGNVYYYFRAKDDLVAAVTQARSREIQDLGALLEKRHRSPKARLKGLVGMVADRREAITAYGCPYGTLCAELVNQDQDSSRALAAGLMRSLVAWTELQFREMGRRDAHDLALELVAKYQGSAAVASALGDPNVFAQQARRMQRWLDGIEA
jgi:TetR/AcrR family transcriptional regulator, transcriptional repressor for nem operon